jgi:hypothetical protein
VDERPATLTAFQWKQTCVSQHNVRYDSLPVSERLSLEASALERHHQRKAIVQSEIDILNGARQKWKQLKIDQGSYDGMPNKVTSFRSSAEQKQSFAEVFKTNRDMLSYEAMRSWDGSPQQLSDTVFSELEQHFPKSNRRALPAWMRLMCSHRDEFKRCVLYVGDGDPRETVYMPLSLCQSPMSIVWLHLKRVPHVLPTFGILDRAIALSVCHTHAYSFGVVDFSLDEIGVVDGDPLWVMDGFSFSHGDVARSHADPIPFETFTKHMRSSAHASERSASTRSKIPKSILDEMRAEFPWLTDEDLGLAASRATDSIRSKSGAKATDEALVLDDVAMDELLERMREEREVWKTDDDDLYFYVKLRGGKWTIEHAGVGNDCVGSFSRAGIATDFCNNYTFPSMKTFRFSKYGVESARALAREWARLGNYYCILWVSKECDAVYDFTADEIHDSQDLDFLDFCMTLNVEDDAWAPSTLLRGYTPKRV